MKLQIDHVTRYSYPEAEVRHSIQYLRLTPPELPNQQIDNWSLSLPAPATRTLDPFGNITHILTLDKPHREIRLQASGTARISGKDATVKDEPFSPLVFLRSTPLTQASIEMRQFADSFRGRAALHGRLREMMHALLERVKYEPGTSSVHSSAAESFAEARGVCQDHAHIFVALCRHLGIPARYVSGYLDSGDHRHVASHAWAEVWVGRQWRTFDISNAMDAPAKHLKLAHGFDYLDASPVRGVRYGGGMEIMHAYALVGSE